MNNPITDSIELVPTSVVSHLIQYPFEFFNPMQSVFIPHLTSVEKNLVITAPTGSGKAQPLSSNILTPEGFTSMDSVRVGDIVIDDTGSPAPVIGIYPQGKKIVYKVEFEDGTSAECCGEHLWSVCQKDSSEFTVIETSKIIEGGPSNFYIPLTKPVEFANATSSCPSTLVIKINELENFTLSVGELSAQDTKDKIKLIWADLGTLNCMKYSDIDNRQKFIGLFLTVFGFNRTYGHDCVITNSDIHDTIAFVARSLGIYFSSIKEVCKTCPGGFSYICSFHADKKTKQITSITEIGEKPCKCISLGNESNLYLTDDFIVTHNTLAAELSIAHCLQSGKKGMYIAPMKSLAEEKLADWGESTHAFSQKKICVLTGDHDFTKAKLAELEGADIILCTSEMLDSKTRNWESNTWLHNVGVLVGDESHIVGAKKRGPCFETAIMRFCRSNPLCRIVLMSATVPNDADYEVWLNRLTGRETQMIRSNYRPCQLHMHYEIFNNTAKQYYMQENARADKVHELVRRFVRDGQSCLVFTGNKAWGRNFSKRLKADGVTCEFHNADLSLEKRREIETTFNNEGYEVLIASSTLAWGVNVNARNVIMAHTSYGKTEMDVADILQAAGRAGRVKYHTEGDCYVILPHTSYEREKGRIEGGFTVKSQLVELSTLMFHIVSEIHNGNVKNLPEMNRWYEGSLAFAQGKVMSDPEWHKVINYLERIRMIKKDEATGNFSTTPLGAISSIMYMSPVTMSDWYGNFGRLNSPLTPQDDGVQLAWALADTAENRSGFLSTADKEAECIKRYSSRVGRLDPVVKHAAIYYALLNDHKIDDSLHSTANQARNDLDRIFNCLYMMHSRYAKFVTPTPNFPGWGRWDETTWMVLNRRMKHSVPASLVSLVSIDGIGKVYATRLYTSGIRNKNDIISNRELFLSIVGEKKGGGIFDQINKAA